MNSPGNLKRLVAYDDEVHLLVESNLAGVPGVQEFYTTVAGIDKQLADFSSQEECGRATPVSVVGTTCASTAAKYRLDAAAPLAELRSVDRQPGGFRAQLSFWANGARPHATSSARRWPISCGSARAWATR